MLPAVSGFLTSLSNIASFFTVPTIGNLYYHKSAPGGMGAVEALKRLMDLFQIGIPIYPDKYEKKGGNEIGQQVLVGGIGTDKQEPGEKVDVTGALVKVADNIVVNPRIWTIHGYIGLNIEDGGILSQGLQITGQVIGTSGLSMAPKIAGALTSFVNKFGREMFNSTMVKIFETISEARRPFKFTTIEGETLPCLIKSYSVSKVAENQNWVEVDLEIQEFRYIALLQNGEQQAVGGASGLYASGMDAVKQCGRSLLKAVAVR